jgi:hypothetical protein
MQMLIYMQTKILRLRNILYSIQAYIILFLYSSNKLYISEQKQSLHKKSITRDFSTLYREIYTIYTGTAQL